ncbi:MAG: gamma-glutamylcyclotransferase [Betaproteobacteria bacterium]|nr:gamma-glutamylcyclotransferase [Betaproteobacteria bacterium]
MPGFTTPQVAQNSMHLLFVYGSLKEGFPNFHVNKGRRVPGRYRTVQPYPLFLANGQLPCLLAAPGSGHQVLGQLFEVSATELAAMDSLEKVGEPGGYRRITIEVEPVEMSPARSHDAFAYVQHESRLAGSATHVGPIAEYTHEHAKSLHW